MSRSKYLYGITEDKYVRPQVERDPRKNSLIGSYKYSTERIVQHRQDFDHNKESIAFLASPETLLNLAAKIIDAFPLPSVYSWTIEDICSWLRKCGYPQYQHTFRENHINGHTLLLLDAAALSAMNITDFHHIQHIALGIRNLYFFETTKFGRSISLSPEYHFELYKQFRTKTGRIYDTTKRSDLWRHMQLIRPQRKYFDHWGALEYHLDKVGKPKYRELVGESRRRELYRCRSPEHEVSPLVSLASIKSCMPPCTCNWKLSELRPNPRLSSTPYLKKPFMERSRIKLLEKLYPHKYGDVLQETVEFPVESQGLRFKTCKSDFSFLMNWI